MLLACVKTIEDIETLQLHQKAFRVAYSLRMSKTNTISH